MINLKVGETNCTIPSQWSDITLKEYSKLYSIIKNNPFDEPEGEHIPETESGLKALEAARGLHNIKVNRQVFSEMTNIDEATINKVDGKQMADTLLLMANFLNGDVEKRLEKEGVRYSFEHKKTKYFYPLAEMKTSTFGDFIEAAQLDMLGEKHDAGKFDVIAEQMAILCREDGEVYDEEKVKKKTRIFENITMEKVWDFIFFLNQQINTYKTHIQTFSKTETEMEIDTSLTIGKS